MKTFRDMTDAEIKASAKEIVRTSKSDDEIKERIATELNYSGAVVVTSVRSDRGERVMLMMHGHDDIIQL